MESFDVAALHTSLPNDRALQTVPELFNDRYSIDMPATQFPKCDPS